MKLRQRGAALVVLLILAGVVALGLFTHALLKKQAQLQQDAATADALAKAKDALIGFAATYRDAPLHAGEVFGYLPCPDTNNDGVSDACTGGPGVTVIGRLPWKTLGLPPLRDGAGECLWYAVSGSFANNPKAPFMNWDTAGQLIVQDAGGTTLAGATPQTRVAAVVFSAGMARPSQTRVSTPPGQGCGGSTSNAVTSYLDGTDPLYTAGWAPAAGVASTVTLATAASAANGSNNDAGLWITPDEIFARIRQRADFPTDVNNLVNSARDCLNAQTTLPDPVSVTFSISPTETPISSGSIRAGRLAQNFVDQNLNCGGSSSWMTTWATWWKDGVNYTGKNFHDNWRDNLLYVKCASGKCLNGGACSGMLIFAGARASGQVRATSSDKNTFANYLEGANLTSFTSNGTAYAGASAYPGTPPSQDVVACINNATPGNHVTFNADIGSFTTAGQGVSIDTGARTVAIASATTAQGGCSWYPTPLTLNGATLRAYYEYQFANPDTSSDKLGYGITLSFYRGDLGAPPNGCGKQQDMGVYDTSNTILFVETDIHKTPSDNDPNGNHSAIMAYGNTTHSPTNGNVTTACNGSAAGCLFSPANTFEETPTPLWHNQRVEIHTGYNSSCSASGGTYALVTAWVDCSGSACANTAVDLAATPTMRRCFAWDTALNTFYFGLTGGFTNGGNSQGVTIRNLDLLTQ